jgi:hypothetical protein
MPNGNSEFNLRECEDFFAPLAGTIERFASAKNLALARYDHESPSWDLNFAHPIGGFGRISLTRTSEAALQLSALVWKDDYHRFARYIRTLPARTVDQDPASLLRELSSTLAEVLTWPFDNTFKMHTGYEPHWGRFSEREFLASQPAFPVPR